MKVIDDTLREANSFLHRGWRKIQHYELKDGEELLRDAELSILRARAAVMAELKKGGEKNGREGTD